MSKAVSHRLPRHILPVNYNLSLSPNFENWTFNGSETIELEVKEQTNNIVINSIEIDIKSAKYHDQNAEIKYDKEMERAILTFQNNIGIGCGKLEIEFSGILNEDMKGFYRSTYTDDDGNEVKMAVTQFEASDARRAFPCFDEPNFKATFDVSLIVPENKVALSNMPVKCSRKTGENLMKYQYERSPRMSTYILAFVVGELDYVESRDANGVVVRVYTPKKKSDRGRFALDVCTKTLPFYATYFGIQYPLPKMDLVAIPDFAAGAMENWGLVTYREAMLLIDEKESSTSTRQIVALVVGHECAHMWFGNLVTMDWWTDLWLNEGFATWIEYLCVDYCYPEFDIWTLFVTSEYARALTLDSLESSHPIEVPVQKPSEIDEIFDSISYAKGASIIRMLNDFLTNDKFKAGLASYLQKHKYGNAVTANLWSSLSEAAGMEDLSVAQVMDTWTKQMGFPIVRVESIQDSTGCTTKVRLQQCRYLASTTDLKGKEQFWLVPVTICRMTPEQQVLKRVVLQPNKEWQTFELDSPLPKGEFAKINPGAVGFYHTQYQEAVLTSMIELIPTLGPRDRLSLIEDQFALAKNGSVPVVNVLDMVRGYKQDDNYTVWGSILENVEMVGSLVDEMSHGALRGHVDKYLLELLECIYRKIGWNEGENEMYNEKMLRPLIISTLGRVGHKEVVSEAQRLFELHYEQVTSSKLKQTEGDPSTNNVVLRADLRRSVYRTVLKHASSVEESQAVYSKLLKLLELTDLQEEKMRIMGCLGCCHVDLIPQVYEFAMGNQVRKQDKYWVLSSTVTNAQTRLLFWKFVTDNWTQVRSNITNAHMLGAVIKGCFQHFATKQMHAEMTQFFKTNKADDFKRNLDQALEKIQNNVEFLDRNRSGLEQFFKQY